jgi:hypothetical protein
MFENLLCNPKNCLQSTVYVTGQSVVILFYGTFLLNFFNKLLKSYPNMPMNKLYGGIVMFLVITIVLISLFYMLINYLCKKGYGSISWLISAVPFVVAIVFGYNLINISNLITNKLSFLNNQ